MKLQRYCWPHVCCLACLILASSALSHQIQSAALQALAGAPLAWAHLLNVRRLWRLYGPTSVFASPGFGWTLPLTALLLATAWYTDAAAPVPQVLDTVVDDVAGGGEPHDKAAVDKQSDTLTH